MNTYSNEKYTITTSLNQGSIHIRLTNNLSYAFYEGNFDTASFRLPFELKDIYELINKCFASFVETSANNKYSIATELDNSVLLLRFRCIMESILTVEFDVRMPEKIMSNDAQLTIHMQKQQQTIDLLSKRLEEMERIISCLGSDITLYRHQIQTQQNQDNSRIRMGVFVIQNESNSIKETFIINTKSLIISSQAFTLESYQKIKHFYQLNDLTLSNLDGTNEPQTQITNASVKTLIINKCSAFADFAFIKNFPNLEELVMAGVTLQFNSINAFKTGQHKIKRIKLSAYGATFNTVDMQKYCSQNGITLNLR